MGAMEMKLHCQCTMVGSITNPSERGLKHGGDWGVWNLNKLEILHEVNGYCWHSVNLCSVHHWRWPCIAENSIWSVLGIWRKSQCVLLGFEALGVLAWVRIHVCPGLREALQSALKLILRWVRHQFLRSASCYEIMLKPNKPILCQSRRTSSSLAWNFWKLNH